MDDQPSAPSLAVLLDNARTAIAAARDAGLDIQQIAVSPDDLATVSEAKKFETRVGMPLQILGIRIVADSRVGRGSVHL
ncbi:hypothetical protein [Nocardia alni]|uniref:hypothetical protein n=1 Tax=Nocardia alni TaxID=2815723 RepID=UPI001C22E572|nr:hypothetical protein [Nocardia alni]